MGQERRSRSKGHFAKLSKVGGGKSFSSFFGYNSENDEFITRKQKCSVKIGLQF